MNRFIAERIENDLVYLAGAGVGFNFSSVGTCPPEYFDEYRARAETEIGRKLNDFRVGIVNKYVSGKQVLDIGIGCGSFVEAYGDACGFDIDSKAVEWLKQRGAFFDPYKSDLAQVAGLTFWDSLEHIERPERILDRVQDQFLFVSLPVFNSLGQIQASKHYKPDEHVMYPSIEGFLGFMRFYGFDKVEVTSEESVIGREGIMTFVLQRKAQ